MASNTDAGASPRGIRRGTARRALVSCSQRHSTVLSPFAGRGLYGRYLHCTLVTDVILAEAKVIKGQYPEATTLAADVAQRKLAANELQCIPVSMRFLRLVAAVLQPGPAATIERAQEEFDAELRRFPVGVTNSWSDEGLLGYLASKPSPGLERLLRPQRKPAQLQR